MTHQSHLDRQQNADFLFVKGQLDSIAGVYGA